MAIPLPSFSWWFWSGKEKEPVPSGSSLNSSSMKKESESRKFEPLVKGTKVAKVKRKWQSREERRRIDREYDVVLVPSDGGGCLSGSESDDSDWSIGWLEPHGSDFQSGDDESDDDGSFAVLVPCYRPGCKEVEASNDELLSAIKNLPNEFCSAGNNYMEQWLANLQNFEA